MPDAAKLNAPRVVVVTGVARFLGAAVAARLAGDDRIERVIGIDGDRAVGRDRRVPARPCRGRAGGSAFAGIGSRDPHREPGSGRPHGRGVRRRPERRRPLGDERAERHRHDAAAGGLPAGARAEEDRDAVVHRGVRRDLPRSGGLHRVHRAARGAARRVRPGHPRHRGLPARIPPPPARRDDHDAAVRAVHRGARQHHPDPLLRPSRRCRPCWAATHDCSSCTSTTRSRCCYRSVIEDHPGTFNVAGAGTITLSQAVRRAGRIAIPVLEPAMSALAGFARGVGPRDFSLDQLDLFVHGRVVDTTRLIEEFGFEPRSTAGGVRRLPPRAGRRRCCRRMRSTPPRPRSWSRSGRSAPAQRPPPVSLTARSSPSRGGTDDRRHRTGHLGRPGRGRAGVPAPPPDRRLRGRRVRLRSGADRRRLPSAAAAALSGLVPGRGHRCRNGFRPRVPAWSSPTTPARFRWTR